MPTTDGWLSRLAELLTPYLPGGGGGTVTSVDTGTGLTGGPITTTGTISVSLIPVANGGTNATNAADARTNLGTNVAGNLTTGTVPLGRLSGITTSQLDASAGIVNGQLANSSVTVAAGTGLTGGGAVALGGTTTLTLADTTVSPATYTRATLTVDQQGRLTSASSGAAISLTADVTGTLPIANGGTNATTASGARTSLGTDDAANITTGALAAAQGGTNVTTGLTVLDADNLVSGTVVVTRGGTGVASNTAYAVLLGGTTSTNPIQSIASVGTTGQVLTSNGAAAKPTFQTAAGGGMTVTVNYFTASGTWTKPANAKLVRVICIAGGDGGGSGRRGAGSSTRSGGQGGNPGFVCETFFEAAQLGATETITIGAGGTGGAAIAVDSTNGNGGGGGNGTYFGGTTALNSKCCAQPITAETVQGGASSTTPNSISFDANNSIFHQSQQARGRGGFNIAGSVGNFGPAGGGGGGHITSGNVSGAGYAGGATNTSRFSFQGTLTGSNGGAGGTAAVGSAGTAATPSTSWILFGSGGGGGGASGSAGRAGGVGGQPGGGGGGGSASANGNASGAGGTGGAGGVIVVTYS